MRLDVNYLETTFRWWVRPSKVWVLHLMGLLRQFFSDLEIMGGMGSSAGSCIKPNFLCLIEGTPFT